VKHRILIYGGLGNVSRERIIPALDSLRTNFVIEYATVDMVDTNQGKHYLFGSEPASEYNSAIIATPNNTHSSITISALNSGLNILCEKPISHTLDSAKQMILVAQNHPALTSMLCDHYIYKPAIRNAIKNWERYRKELGNILSIKATVFERELQKGREWLFFSKIAGGGIAMDTGFHIVSIMGKLFGFDNLRVIESKMKRYPHAPGDAETYASIILSAGQVPIYIEVGKWMGKVDKQIIFQGDKALLTARLGWTSTKQWFTIPPYGGRKMLSRMRLWTRGINIWIYGRFLNNLRGGCNSYFGLDKSLLRMRQLCYCYLLYLVGAK